MRIELRGSRPEVPDSCWIGPNAVVIGNVHLGQQVGIWYNAVVRADTAPITIGDQTNIQDGCVLHVDPDEPIVIGQRVSVGHNAIVHSCTVGDDVLVGMGSTILNGAVVGSNTLIAAGALVLSNARIPAGSLVAGVPAKVRRNLTDVELLSIKRNAARYLQAIDEHATGREY